MGFSYGSADGCDYEASASCAWLIDGRSMDAAGVKLTFSRFELEPQNDFVKVYSEPSERADALVDTLTGRSMIQHTVIVTTATMLVVFRADGTVQANGFAADYAILPRAASRIEHTTA